MKTRVSWVDRFRARFEKFETGALSDTSKNNRYRYWERKPDPNIDSVDLSEHLPKFRYQGRAPSCVGFGIANALQIREGELGKKRGRPSENWIYYIGRWKASDIRIPLTGTYIENALTELFNQGCPDNKYRKYSTKPEVLNKQPTGKQSQMAIPRRGNFCALYIQNNIVDNMVSALQSAKPIVFGTQVTSAMHTYKKGQILHRPNWRLALLGGHCMCVTGYRREENGDIVFEVVNSWRGKEVFFMHEDYFTWSSTHDIAVIE